MIAGRILLFLVLVFGGAGRASAQVRVVLMASAEGRDAIADALRIELAARGAEVVVEDLPDGQTRLIRTANAQSRARETGAIAAVWRDAIDTSAGRVDVVRVAPSSDEDARQSPISVGSSDPRTFALVAASLLDELVPLTAAAASAAQALSEVEFQSAQSDSTARVQVTELAIPPMESTTPEEHAATGPAVIGVIGSVGTGAVVLGVRDDEAPLFGFMTRGTVGVRLWELVRVALLVEALVPYSIVQTEWGMLMGAGLEVGADVPVDSTLFEFGVHGQWLMWLIDLQVRGVADVFPSRPPQHAATVGGSVGVSFDINDPLRFLLRLDGDLFYQPSSPDGFRPEIAAWLWTLTTGLEWM